MTLASTEISEIVAEVWGAMLGLETEVADPDTLGGLPHLTGSVDVTGPHGCLVSLSVSDAAARAFAAAMFAADPHELADDEVVDAVGELTNMVGGNIKSLLPEPSRLSLPVVVPGHGVPAGTDVLNRVALSTGSDAVLITVRSRPAPDPSQEKHPS